ncbi:hypothetical protein BDA99DRAFT_523574 [Phascolomyces articulosus]|uniref:Uncharacterized protein n=1 Tax=Phascolomyces articulosus TaxID=60185 RepID=A0AAD5K070_9FUNG|nr:hypothetical protein BDA99DRAFT_523574 [Phascolomyces articulosus]
MALTYLAGGQTLTGVIFQPRCHQQQQQQQQQDSSSTVSPTLRPLVSAIGGLSSFLTRQTLSPPSTPGINPTSSDSSPSPSPSTSRSSQVIYPLSNNNNETTSYYTTAAPSIKNNHHEKAKETITTEGEGQSLILRRVGLDTITQTLATPSCVTQHLVDLNLTRNHLTDLPDILSTMDHLQSLNISSNLFTTIPSVLFQMHQLTFLNLSDNSLADIPIELPFALPNLIRLVLFGNLLTSLPDSIGRAWTQLQYLQLGSEFSGNRLTTLPDILPPALQVLDISHNRLNHLPYSVTRLKHLIQLDVSYNLLRSFPTPLAEWQRIESMNLSNNRLTLLPKDLVELDALVSLNVSYNLIHVFPEGLLENRSLNVMITGNPLSYPGQHRSAFSRVESDHRQEEERDTSSDSDSESNSSDSDTSNHEQEHPYIREDDTMEPRPSVLFHHLPSSSSSSSAVEPYPQEEENHDPGVNSLYEIAFRQILQSPSSDTTFPTDLLPNHLSQIQQDRENQAHTCVVCKRLFLREWVSSTYCKSYRGYPSVERKIRFCSRQCSSRHAEKARQVAERQETTSNMVPPGPLDFGSFEWIAAAADAAREQQADQEDWF